jgi:hypothetical protein
VNRIRTLGHGKYVAFFGVIFKPAIVCAASAILPAAARLTSLLIDDPFQTMLKLVM